jgi:DNA polymerase III delta prime subunit
MAMAEQSPNEQLHPFFRPRSKVDAEVEPPYLAETQSLNVDDSPRPITKIPAIFLQQQSTKGTTAVSNQPPKKTKIEKQTFECFPPWPDMNIYDGGHVRQKQPTAEELIEMITGYHEERQKANSWPDSNSRQQRRRRQPIAEEASSQFFSHRRATRNQQEQHVNQPSICETTPLKYPLPSRSEMIRLLDTMYPSGWRNNSCISLFDYLYPVPTDDHAMPKMDPREVPWRDKYRPLTIDGLLGNAENCIYLRDWLQEMKVSPIVAPLSKEGKASTSINAKGGGTKSKQKSNTPAEFQDFIVENDDEDDLSKYGFIDIMNTHAHDSDESDHDFMPSINQSRKRRKQISSQTKKMDGKATSNLILLVGCHGVGKTAAVYTAASEVGYDVFEIHAGQKRNAKDILAMVGEMAESHQVSFDNVNRETFDPFANFAKASDDQVITNPDISKKVECEPTPTDTGKRKRGRPKKGDTTPKVKKAKPATKGATGSGDITRHFLRMKVKSVSPPPQSEATTETVAKEEIDPNAVEINVDTSTQENTPGPNQETNILPTPSSPVAIRTQTENEADSQTSSGSMAAASQIEAEPSLQPSPELLPSEIRNPKQSLILLEEVDILFEEDKTFWSAVISLAQKSKRPIVMTCNGKAKYYLYPAHIAGLYFLVTLYFIYFKDISLVPYEVLALQATLYFELPTIEATTQYLQLVCMAEGYLVDPSELYYLCYTFGQDLRKLLNSLELWSRKPDSSRINQMSLYVHRCLIEQIIGSEEMFHDQIASILTQRRASNSEPNSIQNLSIEEISKASDTQSYIDSCLGGRKPEQVRVTFLGMNERVSLGGQGENITSNGYIAT